MATMLPVVVALDGSARDHEIADVAGQLAATTGASLVVVLARTPKPAARLRELAAGEALTPADAAEAYADRIAEPLRRRGIPTASAVIAAEDAATAVATYADRHYATMILTAGGQRTLRRTLAERLTRISRRPVVVVPTRHDRATVRAA